MASTRGKTQAKRGTAKKSASGTPRKSSGARTAKTGARRAPKNEAAYRTRAAVSPHVSEVREAIDAAVAQGREIRKDIESRIRAQLKGTKKQEA